MAISEMINKAVFISSCIGGLADLCRQYKSELTNVNVHKVYMFTKPVPFRIGNDGHAVISLLHMIDDAARVSVSEIKVYPDEATFNNEIYSLKDYTSEVFRVENISSLGDLVQVEYNGRMGEAINRLVDFSKINIMEIFSDIASSCIDRFEQYYKAVNYDRTIIMNGFDTSVPNLLHQDNFFQFLDCNLTLYIMMFRCDWSTGAPVVSYDFNLGLELSAIRSGKNDALFRAIRF